ncbi:MAG TPA: hypothetical protein VK841_12885 [Polyangiaceae bacterium]|nr:hypothetical protein [Polyangiaceae bacterium]
MTMIGSLGGDSVASLAALIMQTDQQDRTQARTLESTEDNAALQDSNRQVAALREKADDDRDSALANGIGEAASGVLTMGSACFAPPSPSNTGFNWNTGLQGAAKAAEGAGAIVSAVKKGDAEQADATAAQYAAASQADARAYDAARSDAQEADESMQKVEQFLQQYQQMENASKLTAASYRA